MRHRFPQRARYGERYLENATSDFRSCSGLRLHSSSSPFSRRRDEFHFFADRVLRSQQY
jgi:hypothetical protein